MNSTSVPRSSTALSVYAKSEDDNVCRVSSSKAINTGSDSKAAPCRPGFDSPRTEEEGDDPSDMLGADDSMAVVNSVPYPF